jgi:hypothetical protein
MFDSWLNLHAHCAGDAADASRGGWSEIKVPSSIPFSFKQKTILPGSAEQDCLNGRGG